VEIADVIGEAIGAAWRCPGSAHADEVGRETAAVPGGERDDVAPEKGRGRVAVQEDDGIASADIDIAHLGVEYAHAPARMRVELRKLGDGHGMLPCESALRDVTSAPARSA